MRQSLVVLTEAVAAGAVLGTAVVWPPVPDVPQPDAVVVLAGDGARVPRALERMEQTAASTLVFAGQPDTAEGAALCTDPQPFEVVCLRPSPDNTRNEARATTRLASERGWTSLLVVTTRFHVARARLHFSRCFDGAVEAVGHYPTYGRPFALRLVLHEWVGLAHATLVERGC